MGKISELKAIKLTQIDTIRWITFLHEAVIKKFSVPSSSDLDASRSSFYFVLRSRLRSSYLCRIRDGTAMKKSMNRYILNWRYSYVWQYLSVWAQLVRTTCPRRLEGGSSASAADPCCHFIQTWSRPNTKIRTCGDQRRSRRHRPNWYTSRPNRPRRPGVGRISLENVTCKCVSGRPRLDLHFLAKTTITYVSD